MQPESQGAAPHGPPTAGPGTVPAASKQPLARRWLAAFGRFWWDFLVGDTPELLIGALIILGIVALVGEVGFTQRRRRRRLPRDGRRPARYLGLPGATQALNDPPYRAKKAGST